MYVLAKKEFSGSLKGVEVLSLMDRNADKLTFRKLCAEFAMARKGKEKPND